ncbi:MAG TPA: acyl-CoA reductase [Calditrichia bacterium]|nr:acyl-CoA reductase [Calditrichia bacterium]
MSIQTFLLDGKFAEGSAPDFDSIVAKLDQEVLYRAPIDLIVKFLAKFGKELTRNLLTEEGVIYLASWLRTSNLEKYIAINVGDKTVLDAFVAQTDNLFMRAQPRGVVCHWVAGNVPTLAIFSIVQAMLGKNASIVRVPLEPMSGIVNILRVLEKVSVELDGQTLDGREVLKSLAVVYYPSSNKALNTGMSLAADAKVIWGGKEAVRDIIALPQREHCENVVFGPKYSFAVVDEASISEGMAKRMAMDIITFDQEACSSPHVIFVQSRSNAQAAAEKMVEHMVAGFEAVTEKFPKAYGSYGAVLNARGMYWLDPEKDVVCSDDLDWTILLNDDIQLEEPVKSRTIFIKAVNSALDVIPLITNKVQTIGIAMQDADERVAFCEQATRHGVARCVALGSMNNYDTPWDGILFINRMVRWTAMRYSDSNGSL